MARDQFSLPRLVPHAPQELVGFAAQLDRTFMHLEEILRNFKSAEAGDMPADDGNTIAGVPVEELQANRMAGVFIQAFDNDVTGYWTLRAGDTAGVTYPSNGTTGGRVLNKQGRMRLEFPENIPYDPRRVYRLRARARLSAAEGPGISSFFRWGLQGIGDDGSTVVNPGGGTNALSGHNVGADREFTDSDVGTFIEFESYVSGNGSPGSNTPGDADNPSRMHTDVRYVRPWFEFNYQGGEGTFEIDFLALDVLTVEAEIDALLTRNAPAEADAEVFTGNDFSLLASRFFANLLRSATNATGLNIVVSQVDDVGDLTETILMDDGVAKRVISKGLTPGASSDGDPHTFANPFQDSPLMVPYPGGIIDGPQLPDTIETPLIQFPLAGTFASTDSEGWDRFLSLPGSAGNRADVADFPALNISGDLDLRIAIAPDDYTPAAANQDFVGRWASGTQWLLRWSTANSSVVFFWRDSTDTTHSAESLNITNHSGQSDGQPVLLKVELDADNGSGGSDVSFYYKVPSTPDNYQTELAADTGWTLINSSTVASTNGDVKTSTSPDLHIGARSDGSNVTWAGKFYGLILHDGINGTPVVDIDFFKQDSLDTSFTEDANAETVTVDQSGSPAAEIFTGFNVPVNKSGMQDDDVLYLAVGADLFTAYQVPLDSWVELADAADAAPTISRAIYRRVVTSEASEADSVFVHAGTATNPTSPTDFVSSILFSARGLDTASPEDAESHDTAGVSDDSTPRSVNVTTATDNAFVVSLVFMVDGDGGMTFVPPTDPDNFTLLFANEQADADWGVAYLRQETAGDSNPGGSTHEWPNTGGDGTEDFMGSTIALKPATQPTNEEPEIIPKVLFDGLTPSGFDEFIAKLLARVVEVSEESRSFAAGTLDAEGETLQLASVLDDDADDDQYRAQFDITLNVDAEDDLVSQDDNFGAGVIDAAGENKEVTISTEANDDQYTVRYDWDLEVTASGDTDTTTDTMSGSITTVGGTAGERTLSGTADSGQNYTVTVDVVTLAGGNSVTVAVETRPFGGSTWTQQASKSLSTTGLDTLTFSSSSIGEGDSIRIKVTSHGPGVDSFRVDAVSVAYPETTFNATSGFTAKVQSFDGSWNDEDTTSKSITDTDGVSDTDSGSESVVFTRDGVTKIRVIIDSVSSSGSASSRTHEVDPNDVQYTTGESTTATIKVTVALDAKDAAGAWVEKDTFTFSLTDTSGSGASQTFSDEELSFTDSAIDEGDDIRLRIKKVEVSGDTDSNSFSLTADNLFFNLLSGETQEVTKTPLTSDEIIWFALAG